MKKLLTIFVLMLIGVSGLLFYGCDERYENLTIEVKSVSQLNQDGELVMYVGDEPQEVNITVSGAPGDFNFVPLISMTKNIVRIEDDIRINGNVVTEKITAFEPGNTVVEFITSEGNKRASLKIRVVMRAESVAFRTPNSVTAIENSAGAEVKLGISDIVILPQNSNQSEVIFSPVNPVGGVSLTNDGILRLSEVVGATSIEVKATVVENGVPVMNGTEEVSATGWVDIVKVMNSKLFIAGDSDKLISEGNSAGEITLVKNIEALNAIRLKLEVETHGQAVTVDYPKSLSEPFAVNLIGVTDILENQIVQKKIYEFEVSAIRYAANYPLNFRVELSNYVGRFKDYGTSVFVTCDSLIRDFAVDGEVILQEPQYFHEKDIYIGDSTGTTFKLRVFDPADIPAENNKFFMELYKHSGTIYELVENPTDMFDLFLRNTQLESENGRIGLMGFAGLEAISGNGGADIRVRVKDSNIAVTDDYMLRIVSENPKDQEEYQDLVDYYNLTYADTLSVSSLRAYTQVKFNLLKGVTSIDSFEYNFTERGQMSPDPELNESGSFDAASLNINMELDGEHAIRIFTSPQDASNKTIRAESSAGNIFAVGEIDYSGAEAVILLSPLNVGTATLRISSTTLPEGQYKTIQINVFKPINDVFVGLYSFDLDKVGQSIYENIGGQNSLSEVTVKTGQTVRFEYFASPLGSLIKDISYEVYQYQKLADGSIDAGSEQEFNEREDGKYSFSESVQNVMTTVFEFNPSTRGFYILPSGGADSTPYAYKIVMKFSDFANNEIVQEVLVKGYVPVEKIILKASESTIYNPEFLGYEDIELGKHSTEIEVTVLPANATFKFDPNKFNAFSVREGGSSANSEMLGWVDLGLNRFKFSINDGYTISSDRRVYIIARIDQFQTAMSQSIGIDVLNPKRVSAITAENVVDSEIIFKVGLSQPFTLDLTILPMDALNRNVELLQFINTGTVEAPEWVRADAETNSGLCVFAVNGYTIVPLKAGQARLVVVPKDRIKNAEFDYEWENVLDIFVDVTDGSAEHPYYVSNLQELKDIGLSAETMNKYYVLTRDVAFGVLEPIGLSIDTAFSGGLSGKYERTRGEEYYTTYNSINSIVYSTASSATEYLGLFYRIDNKENPDDEGDPNRGVISDLTVSYQHIQAEFNGAQLVFGGVAAINDGGTLRDVVVQYPSEGNTGFSVNFITGIDTSFVFGGLVGQNNGSIIIDNPQKIGVAGKISVRAGNPVNYIGGVAGKNTGRIVGMYAEQDESEIEINFGSAGYTSTLNIVARAEGGLSVSDMGIGGITGRNEGFINGVAADGRIDSNFNFVGGVAGQSISGSQEFYDAEISPLAMSNIIKNSFSSCVISGNDNVGGLVGYSHSTYIYGSSAENYRSFGRTNATRNFVEGSQFVGGLIGSAFSANIAYSYVVSYFNDSASYDIVGTSSVGGFAGQMQDCVLSKVAVFANISGASSGAFVGSYLGGTVEYFMVRAYGQTGLAGSGMSFNPTNGYYQLNGGNVVYSNYSQSDILDDTTNWGADALVNDGMPYLKNKEGGILFATNPLSVSAVVKGEVGENSEIFIKTDTGSAIIFYTQSRDLDERQLMSANNIFISDFANVDILPLTSRSSRVEIISSNSLIVSVNANGTLQLNGVGDVVLTISSRLNASYSVQLQISVRYGINGFALYKSANMTEADKLSEDDSANVQTLSMLTGTKQALYSETGFEKVIDGRNFNLESLREVGVRYKVLADDEVLVETQQMGVGIADIFRINNLGWQFYQAEDGEDYWYVDVNFDPTSAVGTGATIEALYKTEKALEYNGIRISAQPYVTSSGGGPVLLDMRAVFELKIDNGATGIKFADGNLSQITMTQLDTYILTVIMDTDAEDDEIILAVASESQDSQSSKDDLVIVSSLSEDIRDSESNLIGKKKRYTINFTNKTTLIDRNRNYNLQFSSSTNNKVKLSTRVVVKPQPIISADLSLYTEAELYGEEDGKSKVVYNEVPAIMQLDVYPYFSLFDSFTITYTSSAGNNAMTIAQAAFDKDSSTFNPHPSFSAVAIENGLRILKQTGLDSPISGADGKYSYSKMFYFSLFVADTNQVQDFSSFNVRVTFYKDGAVVEPRNITYSFVSISEPVMSVELADTSLKGAVPLGTEQEITVNVRNFDGVPEFSIEKIFVEGDEYNPVSLADSNRKKDLLPVFKNGKYYITIPSDIQTSSTNTLAGATIRYKVTATKDQNLKREVMLDVYVTEYTVTSVRISNTEIAGDRYKLQGVFIYESKDLNIELVVAAADMRAVQAEIDSLAADINRAAARNGASDGVWWYYDSTGVKQPLYDNSSGVLYNGVFMFRSNSDGSGKSVYGHKVDMPTTVAINIKLGYSGGKPAFVRGDPQGFSENLRSRALDFEFVLEFSYQDQLRNAMPINNAEEFYAMETGKDYRLINDIYLPLHTPINTAIASLDGNNKTIYITGFSYGADTVDSVALGLFGTVNANTLLMNVSVHYAGAVTNIKGTTNYYNISYNTGFTVDEDGNQTTTPITLDDYERDPSHNKYYSVTNYQSAGNSLDVSYNSIATGSRFGGIAAVNQGVVTNAKVSGRIRIFTAAGADILLSGGLVAENNGYITNSAVKDFDMTANNGNMGGVVGLNAAKISTTYADGIRIENTSQGRNMATAGFVYQNTATGVIDKSFAQGKRAAEDTGIRNSGGGIQSANSTSGFVYLNGGTINDSYANIILSHNSSLAGFVFNNENNGRINNCYSTLTVARTGSGQANDASAFTGFDVSKGEVLNSGQITNSYYLDPNNEFTPFNKEKALELNVSQFSAMSSFPGFSIAQNIDSEEGEEYTEGYTWLMTGGRPQLVFTLNPTASEFIYKNRDPENSLWKNWNAGFSVQNATVAGVYSVSAASANGELITIEYMNNVLKKSAAEDETEEPEDLVYEEGSTWRALEVVGAWYGTGSNSMQKVDFGIDGSGNYNIYVWVDINEESGELDPTSIRLIQYNVPEYYQYRYTGKTGVPAYGEKNNPIIIYNAASYDYEFDKVIKSGEGEKRQYVRFVADVDFDMAKSAVTALSEKGISDTVIDGNNMWINNIVLLYNNSDSSVKDAFGLFSRFTDVVASGLNLSIIEIKSSSHYFVGGLVGVAGGETFINNVTVKMYDNSDSSYLILGRNFAGGIVGYATGKFRMENINASVNVSSTYVVSNKYVYEPLNFDGDNKITTDKTVMVSYAGAVAGVIDADSILPNEPLTVANARNITVSGQAKVAGRTAGGVFGLIGKKTYVRDINYVLQGANQYVHANNYGGGIVGENRGTITNSSIRYDDITQNLIDASVAQSAPSGGVVGNRNFFANGTISVVAIGGIVGFNNNGVVENCASALDVRNLFATIAGGAVGRMMSGTINKVTTSGSVLAGSIIGGLVGNIVSYNRAVKDAAGVFDDSQEEQFGILLDAGGNHYNASDISKLSPIITNCVVATNFLNNDFNVLAATYGVARVTGGLFGTITTLGLDTVIESEDLANFSARDDIIKTDQINNNYYVNSLYNTPLPTETAAAARTLYMGYQSYYLDSPLMTTAMNATGRTYPGSMIVPSEWTINDEDDEYSVSGSVVDGFVGENNIGRSHFELRRGNERVYSENTGIPVSNEDLDNNGVDDKFEYSFIRNFATDGYDINMENARLAANSYKSLIDALFGGAENVGATDNSGNSVEITEWKSEVDEDRVGGNLVGFAVTIEFSTDIRLAGNVLKSAPTSFKTTAFKSSFTSDIWDKSRMIVGSEGFMVLPKVLPNSQVSVWTDFIKPVNTTSPTSNEYRITTAEELAWVAEQVNSGVNNFSGKTIKLMNDIDLSGRYWVPIGKDSANAFSGVFDGNGHAIGYATVDNNSMSNDGQPSTKTVPLAGVFGYVSRTSWNNATIIMDLTVSGGIIKGYIAGGVAGFVANAEVINCVNTAIVSGVFASGGIVGYSYNDAVINGVTNYGEVRLNNAGISATDFSNAGIYNKLNAVLPLGLVDELIYEQEYQVPNEVNSMYYIGVVKLYAGGLAGKITSIDISNAGASKNYGRVTVSDTLTNYSASVVKIDGTSDDENDENYGRNVQHIRASLYAGGFAGFAEGMSVNYGNYRVNYGSVNIVSNAHILSVGGIFGELYSGGALKAQNIGSITVAYQNAQVTPNDSLPGEQSSAYQTDWASDFAVGGVVGRVVNSTVEHSGNFARVDASDVFSNYAIGGVGGVAGKMHTGSIINSFNTNAIKARAATQATSIGVGGVVGLVMGGKINLYDDENIVSIENSYNIGKISSDNKAVLFMGGVVGAVIYEKEALVSSYVQLYDIGDETLGSASALGSAGEYVYGQSEPSLELNMLELKNTYNAGAVSVESERLRNMLGGLVGYDSNIAYVKSGVNPSNFYLVSAYSDAGAFRVIDDDSSFAIRESVDPTLVEAKTSEGLKLLVNEHALPNADWGKTVDTWYPTLIGNDTELYWQDYRESFVASEANVYDIYTAEQLAQLSYMIKQGRLSSTEGLAFRLMGNIDLSNKYWTPIGTENNPFRGTFDGNNYQISSLTVDGNKKDITGAITSDGHRYGALFGFIDGAVIKNLSLLGPSVFNTEYAAGIVADAKESTIQFVYTEPYKPSLPDGTVWGKIEASTDYYYLSNAKTNLIAAGIVGRALNSIIENSYNNVNVSIKMPDATSGYYDEFNDADNKIAAAGGIVGILERDGSNADASAELKNTYNNTRGKVTNPMLNNTDITDSSISEDDIMVIVGEIRYSDETDNPTNLASKIIIQNNYNVAEFEDAESSEQLLKIIDAVKDETNTNMVYIHNNTTASLKQTTLEDVVNGLGDESVFGFDFNTVWSGEYSLNEVSKYPSLRGLGEHWTNTQSEPLARRNVLGQTRAEATSEESGSFNTYEISTAEELAWVASGVNNGTLDSSGFIFRLTDNIDLDGRYWTPIGASPLFSFKGIFNFNGKTISNMIIDSSDLTYGGLFGYVSGNSRNGDEEIAKTEIKNGRLENAFVKLNNNSEQLSIYAGALVARGANVTIRNIDITARVYAESKGNSNVYAGGMSGLLRYDYYQIIDGVTVSGYETGLRLDEVNQGKLSENGISGNGYDNIGVVAASVGGGIYTGGLAGYVLRNYPEKIVFGENGVIIAGIKNIETDINIFAVNNNTETKTFDIYAAGVLGYSGAQVISNVTAKGNIKTYANVIDEEYVGGIVGYMAGTLLNNAYKDGGFIEGSKSLSNITVSYIGGIVACAESSIMGFSINTARTVGATQDRISGGIFGYAVSSPQQGNTLETTGYDKDRDGTLETGVAHIYLRDETDPTTFQTGFGYCFGVNSDSELNIYYSSTITGYNLDEYGFTTGQGWHFVDNKPVLDINRSVTVSNLIGVDGANIFVGNNTYSGTIYTVGESIEEGQYIFVLLPQGIDENLVYINGTNASEYDIVNVTVSNNNLYVDVTGVDHAVRIEVTGYYDFEIVYRGQ